MRRTQVSPEHPSGGDYSVRLGDQWFDNLSPDEAVARLRELGASGADAYLFDRFGDPMGLVELEEAIDRGQA